MDVRRLEADEKNDALNLAREVFFTSGNFGMDKEGAKSFLEYLSAKGEALEYYGAYDGDLRGILGFREEDYHLALFFVRKEDQRKGTGTALMNAFLREAESMNVGRITVRALDKAVNAYKAFGFEEDGEEKKEYGTGFVPMEYLLNRKWLGKKVTVTVELPYGSLHPSIPDTLCSCNTGYVDELIGDGDFVEAYVYGPEVPVEVFHGIVIALIYHRDSSICRFVVGESTDYSRQDVINAVAFAEQYSDTRFIWLK